MSDENPTFFQATPEQLHLIGSWISAYARGETKDQVTVMLDRLFKERQPRTATPDRAAIIRHFVNEYISGDVQNDALDEYVARSAATEADESMSSTLSEKVRELEALLEESDEQCRQAHNWRYHLESRAREVDDLVTHLRKIAKRAPTKEELDRIGTLLREAINYSRKG